MTSRSEAPPKKKKRKALAKGKLSFGDDEEEEEEEKEEEGNNDIGDKKRDESSVVRSSSKTPAEEIPSRRVAPNPNAPPPPKVLTKATLDAEAKTRDALRKEFLAMQEAIKNTEILIPFIFYDGTNIPAGAVKVKKGDPVWLFLDRSRKVGAEMGVGKYKGRRDNRREWARASVDDLILVRGDIIIPHV